MIAARNTDGRIVYATPHGRAHCPECGEPVIAKCGDIIRWHWAHLANNSNCPVGQETAWHLGWKWWALEQGCEVEVKLVEGFRADIVTPLGAVIELQTGGQAPDTIRAREDVYGSRLRWLFLVDEDQEERFHWGSWLHPDGVGRGFWYKRGPKSLAYPRAPVYLELGGRRDDGEYAGTLIRAKINLKEKQTQYGTSMRMLGIGWPAEARVLFDLHAAAKPLCQECGELPAVRERMCGYCWLKHNPVRTSRDKQGQPCP